MTFRADPIVNGIQISFDKAADLDEALRILGSQTKDTQGVLHALYHCLYDLREQRVKPSAKAEHLSERLGKLKTQVYQQERRLTRLIDLIEDALSEARRHSQ